MDHGKMDHSTMDHAKMDHVLWTIPIMGDIMIIMKYGRGFQKKILLLLILMVPILPSR